MTYPLTNRPPAAGVAPQPQQDAFLQLAPNERQPSELDANPRFLRLQRFQSRFLPTPRDILVYLPAAYASDSTRRFPVFYLHDGQNLFDGRTSFLPGHTWRAHTTADQLTAAGLIEPVILLGVDNTGVNRIAEYTPTRDPQRGGGLGPSYGRLLVEELKPLIDHTFRTLPGPADTALGGSSLGGLISLALGLDYPTVFAKLAVLSPSLWWDDREILERVKDIVVKPDLRIWLDIGKAEGLRHLRDTDLLYRRLLRRGWRGSAASGFQRDSAASEFQRDNATFEFQRGSGLQPDLRYLRAPAAIHDEDAWAARFDQVLLFLFPHRQR